jgi:hypothetical protein
LAVAVTVGVAVAVDACLALRRAYSEAAFAAPGTMLAEAMGAATPRIAVAGAGGALAAATLFAIPLPAAQSAAVGGIGATIMAALSAPFAMGSLLALVPAKAPAEGGQPTRLADRLRYGPLGRVADGVSHRPWLAWIPAVIALAALGAATSQAFDADATALTAADLDRDSEPARVALLVADELPPAEVALLASGASADTATDLFAERLPWILGALTALGLLAAFLASRSPRDAIANGLGAGLPAGAVCGLFAVAGETPHASVLFVAVAALGAVGVARAALPGVPGALASSLVAGAAVGVLAGAELDAVAQAGVALAAGLALDLVLVRAVLAPCLERALPARLP